MEGTVSSLVSIIIAALCILVGAFDMHEYVLEDNPVALVAGCILFFSAGFNVAAVMVAVA